MCKCCQSCLETIYWNCCEERFCYDESIAKYSEDSYEDKKCYANHTGSLESLEPITRQPRNNNHLSNAPRAVLAELPILAPDIYRVFSNSMIFKEHDLKKNDLENIPYEPKFKTNANSGKAVKFKTDGDESDKPKEDEKPATDFEIMFQDELYGDHTMFKIDEEEEEEKEESELKSTTMTDGIPIKTIDNDVPISSIPNSLPDEILHKPEGLIKHLPRSESSRSIIRTNSGILAKPKGILLPRADSTRSFTRSNSRQDLLVKRVNSMKSLDNKNIKNVLARLPPKSASFLSLDDLLSEQKDTEKSESIYTISTSDLNLNGEHSQISKMPDTPVIKGGKLPKFFVETPVIGEYKAETSLQSILKSPDVIFVESDFSMPRYYGKSRAIGLQQLEAQSSKSLPDLHNPDNEKVSKRLTKLRSKLKPLIIKKHDEHVKNVQQT